MSRQDDLYGKVPEDCEHCSGAGCKNGDMFCPWGENGEPPKAKLSDKEVQPAINLQNVKCK